MDLTISALRDLPSDVEIRVVVLPGGKLQVFIDGPVSFEQAKAINAAVFAKLTAQGLAFERVDAPESHRDATSDHAHVIEHTHPTH